jgi:hypothetical protein
MLLDTPADARLERPQPQAELHVNVGGSVMKAMTRISPAEMGHRTRIQPPPRQIARRCTTKINDRLPSGDGQLCA